MYNLITVDNQTIFFLHFFYFVGMNDRKDQSLILFHIVLIKVEVNAQIHC